MKSKVRIPLPLIILLTVVVGAYYILFVKVYLSESIEGRVVDEATGKSIPNAVVVARWQLRGMENFPSSHVWISETKTNEDGYFKIDEWGPVRVWRMGLLRSGEPYMHVLKAGYIPKTIWHICGRCEYDHPVGQPMRYAAWDELVIDPERHDEIEDDEIYRILREKTFELIDALRNDSCAAESIPMALNELISLTKVVKDDENRDELNGLIMNSIGRTNCKIE
ncbi:carboxypeptidase-like regulatory domain-containing protein [Pseudomonadota bacterium]